MGKIYNFFTGVHLPNRRKAIGARTRTLPVAKMQFPGLEMARLEAEKRGENVRRSKLSRDAGKNDSWYRGLQNWRHGVVLEDFLFLCAELKVSTSKALNPSIKCSCPPPTKKEIERRAALLPEKNK